MSSFAGITTTCFAVALAFAQAEATAAAAAKDYPTKPVRLVIPYAPGGGVDVVGYAIQQKLGAALGQNVLFDNRPGAGGVLGTEIVAKSAPDGYTMLLTSGSFTTTPYFFKKLPFDPVRDFAPVTQVAKLVGLILVVNPSLPVKNVKELIALAKAHPGQLNYGSAGIGNVLHLAAEIFSMAANVKMTHVPYKGVANALTDLVGGQIEVCFPPAPTVPAYANSGRIRALAIGAPKRWAQMPNLPTLEEAGLKGYELSPWFGLWYPAGTPVEYVNRMQNEVAKVVKDPAVRKNLEEQGMEGAGSTPAEFEKTIADELVFFKKLTTRMGVVPQ